MDCNHRLQGQQSNFREGYLLTKEKYIPLEHNDSESSAAWDIYRGYVTAFRTNARSGHLHSGDKPSLDNFLANCVDYARKPPNESIRPADSYQLAIHKRWLVNRCHSS